MRVKHILGQQYFCFWGGGSGRMGVCAPCLFGQSGIIGRTRPREAPASAPDSPEISSDALARCPRAGLAEHAHHFFFVSVLFCFVLFCFFGFRYPSSAALVTPSILRRKTKKKNMTKQEKKKGCRFYGITASATPRKLKQSFRAAAGMKKKGGVECVRTAQCNRSGKTRVQHVAD